MISNDWINQSEGTRKFNDIIRLLCVCVRARIHVVYINLRMSLAHTQTHIPDPIDEVMKPNCIPHFALDFDHNGFILCNKLMDLLMNENDQFIGKRDRNPVISTAN